MNCQGGNTKEIANSALKRSGFWQLGNTYLLFTWSLTGSWIPSQVSTEMLSYGGTPLACAAIVFEALPYNFRSKWIITLFPLAFSRGNIMGTCNADAFKLSQQTSLCRLIPCCVPNSLCETRNKQLLKEGTVSDNGCHNQSMHRGSMAGTALYLLHFLQVTACMNNEVLKCMLLCHKLLGSILFLYVLGIWSASCAYFLKLLGWRVWQSAWGILWLINFIDSAR